MFLDILLALVIIALYPFVTRISFVLRNVSINVIRFLDDEEIRNLDILKAII